MSLLHQVLQDIDQRTAVKAPALPFLPLPIGSSDRLRLGSVAVALVLILSFIGLFFFHSESLSSDQWKNNTPLHLSTVPQPRAVSEADQHVPEAVAAVPPRPAVPDTSEARTEAEPPPPIEPLSGGDRSPGLQESPQTVQAGQPANVTTADTTRPDPVRIVRSRSPAQSAYLSAIQALQKQDYQLALAQIEQALAADPQVPYQTLKLRLLLEQKQAAAFVGYYRQHADNSDPHWLAVAGPGLHMMGYPALAVTPYQQLTVMQPDIVNWPLALAAAWEEQKKPVPALAVLKNVMAHYSLTASQRQWVVQKIEVLGGQSRS